MPLEKLVFASTIESLFVRQLGARWSSHDRERLAEAGLDLSRRLAVSYPLEQWKTFVRIAAEALYPQLPAVEAHRWMGIHFLEGHLQTFLGRMVAELAPTLGPLRTLERVGQDFRSGNNFSEVRVVELSSRHIELWMNDVLCEHPSFAAGFILRAQHLAGARGAFVDVRSFDGTACTFDVRWREAVVPQAVNG
jgi:uncharacterized protein (TIGR02265 family)